MTPIVISGAAAGYFALAIILWNSGQRVCPAFLAVYGSILIVRAVLVLIDMIAAL